MATRLPSKLRLCPAPEAVIFAVRSSCGNAFGLFGSAWNGPVMLALALPLWEPEAEPLRLMSRLPLLTLVGLLKV